MCHRRGGFHIRPILRVLRRSRKISTDFGIAEHPRFASTSSVICYANATFPSRGRLDGLVRVVGAGVLDRPKKHKVGVGFLFFTHRPFKTCHVLPH